MNRCVLLWTPNIGTRVELISKAWNSAITPTIIQNSFRHSGLYALSLQRALDAMGGRYDAGMEYAPPELLLEDSTTAFDIWGEVTPQVLAAQQFALDNDGIYIVNRWNIHYELCWYQGKCAMQSKCDPIDRCFCSGSGECVQKHFIS